MASSKLINEINIILMGLTSVGQLTEFDYDALYSRLMKLKDIIALYETAYDKNR